MTLYESCLYYLDIICIMSEHPGLYGLDSKRTKLHYILINKLKEEFSYNESRLNIILGELDIAIDFIPPLERYDSVKIYARELERLLTCAEGKLFLKSKFIKLNTKYGVIEAGSD